jgi:small basic protein
MTPEELGAYASIATLIVSIVISIILHRATTRFARAEHERSIREWWNTLNETALSSDKMLLVADELMNPLATTQSLEEKRRRWFAFLVLNALSSSFLGAKDGLSRSRDDTISIVKHHLRILLASDDIYVQSQQGYEAKFAALCREIREELEHAGQLQSASPPSTKIV